MTERRKYCPAIACSWLIVAIFLRFHLAVADTFSIEMIAAFSGTNGAYPWASLIQATDGNFYGTTYSGGASTNLLRGGWVGCGSVFKVTPSGDLTCLASLFLTNGANPRAALVQADDGNFYGTTHNGGAYPGNGPWGDPGAGTVFRVTPNGDLTTLASFWITNGACPAAGLTKGPNGILYGVTRCGGSTYGDPRSLAGAGWGTVFKLTTNGDFTTIASLPAGQSGGGPMVPLTFAREGNFYGVAADAIFRMTPAGIVSTVAVLNETNSVSGLAALLQARDSSFYGVSQVRGVYNHGAVYSVSTNGTQTTVASFTNGIGLPLPWGALIEGTDGNFYGTRDGGYDISSYGSVYRASRGGTWTTIATFALTNGATPQCGLVQGRDGMLYGTAEGGGPIGASGYGTIFRVSIPSAAAPKFNSIAKDSSGVSLSWTAIPNRSYQMQFGSSPDAAFWTNLGTMTNASDNIASVLDDDSAPSRFYRIVLLP